MFFTKFINFLKINKALPLAVLIPYLSIAVAMISSVVHAKVPLQANPASVAPCANSVYPALRDKRVFCLLTVSSKQKDRPLAILLFWRKRWDSGLHCKPTLRVWHPVPTRFIPLCGISVFSAYSLFHQNKRTAVWRSFCFGGSGGIRTHGTKRYN